MHAMSGCGGQAAGNRKIFFSYKIKRHAINYSKQLHLVGKEHILVRIYSFFYAALLEEQLR